MKVKLLCLVIITVMLGCTACVTIREINTLNFVLAFAVDYEPQTETYILTFQVPKTQAQGKETSGSKWLIYQAKGKTIFEAIRNMNEHSSRRLYFAHCDVYMVGEEFAKAGIKGLVDLLQRDGETRVSTSHLMVVKGRAADLMAYDDGREVVPAQSIENILDMAENTHSKAPNVTIKNFIKNFFIKSPYSLLPVISTSTPNIKAKEATTKLKAGGSGVFKKDRLIGFLNPLETRGCLWANGDIKSTILVGEMPGGKDKFTFEISSAESSIKPVLKDNELSVDIEIEAVSTLGEEDSFVNLDDPEKLSKLENLQNNLITSEVNMAIDRAQELKADIFGIGEILHKYHPEVWKQVEGEWEEVFAGMEFSVQVDSLINRTGRITDLS